MVMLAGRVLTLGLVVIGPARILIIPMISVLDLKAITKFISSSDNSSSRIYIS